MLRIPSTFYHSHIFFSCPRFPPETLVIIFMSSLMAVISIVIYGEGRKKEPSSHLHDQKVSWVTRVLSFMNRDLVFVGRVEGDFADLLVPCSVGHNIVDSQFHTFKKSSLRGITVHLTFQDRNAVLIWFEFSSVANSCHSSQCL